MPVLKELYSKSFRTKDGVLCELLFQEDLKEVDVETTENFDPQQPRDENGRWTTGASSKNIDTKAFKAWFGDSQVVDEKGEPKVLYHGTRKAFTSFDPDKLGSYTGANSAKKAFFFSDDPEVAGTYPDGLHEVMSELNATLPGPMGAPSSLAYTSLQAEQDLELAEASDYKVIEEDGGYNYEMTKYDSYGQPYTYTGDWIFEDKAEADDAGYEEKEKIVADATSKLEKLQKSEEQDRIKASEGAVLMPVYMKMENPLVYDFNGGDYQNQSFSELIDEAIEDGYDGVIFKNVNDAAIGSKTSNVYAVFNPKHIKSASGNKGKFDADDDNINNIFCPTGKGGGIDPTCSPGGIRSQVNTPEFKEWFGDWTDPKAGTSRAKESVSLAVNPDGSPKVFYHGTNKDFNEFELGRSSSNSNTFGNWDVKRHGIFFAPNVNDTDPFTSKGEDIEGANIKPVFLDIKSPLNLRSNAPFSDQISDEELESVGLNPRWGALGTWEMFDGNDGNNFVEGLKTLGYDGVIFEDENPDTLESVETWVVFSPNQIKSAIGNRGTFDKHSKDVRNVFCPTGEGGGVDPTCKSGESKFHQEIKSNLENAKLTARALTKVSDAAMETYSEVYHKYDGKYEVAEKEPDFIAARNALNEASNKTTTARDAVRELEVKENILKDSTVSHPPIVEVAEGVDVHPELAQAMVNKIVAMKPWGSDESKWVAGRYKFVLIKAKEGYDREYEFSIEAANPLDPAPKDTIEEIPNRLGYVYRGMSREEWDHSVERGHVQSIGDHNLDQDGFTFYGKADTAAHYATGFAPTNFAPAPGKPAVIIEIPRSLVKDHTDYPDKIPQSEFAHQGAIPLSDITSRFEATVTEFKPGTITIGWDNSNNRLSERFASPPRTRRVLSKVKESAITNNSRQCSFRQATSPKQPLETDQMFLIFDDAKQTVASFSDSDSMVVKESLNGNELKSWLAEGVPSRSTRSMGEYDVSINSVTSPNDPSFWISLQEHFDNLGWSIYEFTENKFRPVVNVFCPTGKHGGVDPTCPHGGRGVKRKNPAAKMLRKLKLAGGLTYLSVMGAYHKDSGYSVSPYPELSAVFDGRITKEDIKSFLERHKDVLSKPNHALGIYKDAADGKIFLDVSIITKSKDDAEELGRKYNQRSYYDFAKNEVVDTGGTGEPGNNCHYAFIANRRPDRRFGRGPQQALSIENVFCPTGVGGGIDPTCSPKGANRGTEKEASTARPGVIGTGRTGSDGQRVYPGTLREVPSKEFVTGIARSYVREHKKELGLNDLVEREPESLDTIKSKNIGEMYESMPLTTLDDPETLEAYKQLAKETLMQYKAMIDHGMTVDYMEDDPYASSKDMMDDVANNKHLRIFLTSKDSFGSKEVTHNHPLLEETGLYHKGRPLLYNDVFRAVHDFFGHAMQGNEFGPVGEERAWAKHSLMFSETARKAMSFETRGQNSWVNFGPHMYDKDGWKGDKKHPRYVPPGKRPYAEQKVGVMPDGFVHNSVAMAATGMNCGIGPEGFKIGNTCAKGGSSKNKPIVHGRMAKHHAGETPKVKGSGEGGTISVRDGLLYLDSLSPNNIDLGKPITDAELEIIAKELAGDVIYAYEQTDHQGGWYQADIQEMFDILSERHPELKSDPDHRFIMSAAMSVTSPGSDVLLNLRDAEFLYSEWKRTGKFAAKNGFTSQQVALPKQCELIQTLIDKKGIQGAAAILDSTITVREIEALGISIFPELEVKKFGKTGKPVQSESPWGVGDEHKDAKVPVFAILGPKLGPFYANIRGQFEHVTIDMWEMRHLGSISGHSILTPDPDEVKKYAATYKKLRKENKIPDWHGISPEAFDAEIEELLKTGVVPENSVVQGLAKKYQRAYAQSKFKDKTAINKHGHNTIILFDGVNDAPRNGTERKNYRKIFDMATKLVQEAGYKNATPAEVQAVSWSFIQRALKKTGADVYIDVIDPETKKIIPKTFSEGSRRLLSGQTQTRKSWEPLDKLEKPKKSKTAKKDGE